MFNRLVRGPGSPRAGANGLLSALITCVVPIDDFSRLSAEQFTGTIAARGRATRSQRPGGRSASRFDLRGGRDVSGAGVLHAAHIRSPRSNHTSVFKRARAQAKKKNTRGKR